MSAQLTLPITNPYLVRTFERFLPLRQFKSKTRTTLGNSMLFRKKILGAVFRKTVKFLRRTSHNPFF